MSPEPRPDLLDNNRSKSQAVHPMLVGIPLGLFATSVVFDILYLVTGNTTMATVSYWLIAAGVVGALVAAIPGAIDWLAIPRGTRAKRIGALHGGGNLVVAALFFLSFLARDTLFNSKPHAIRERP